MVIWFLHLDVISVFTELVHSRLQRCFNTGVAVRLQKLSSATSVIIITINSTLTNWF